MNGRIFEQDDTLGPPTSVGLVQGRAEFDQKVGESASIVLALVNGEEHPASIRDGTNH